MQKQSGGQTSGPLTIDHICKDARSRPLTPLFKTNSLTFFTFLSIDLTTIEFYTDGSLTENKSSGTIDMGSGWISLNGDCDFCCKTSTWPSSTRAELLA